MSFMAAQQSITNFYLSVQFQHPALAQRMSNDIRTVALYGISGDRIPAYPAVISLRDLAQGLPMVFEKILDNALEDLGYSLRHVYEHEAAQD